MQERKWVSVDRVLGYILVFAIGLVLGFRLSTTGKIPFTNLPLPFLNSQNASYSDSFKTVNLDLFWQIWQVLQQRYLKPEDMKTDKMVEGAISGMVDSLGDPYTIYLPADDKKISEEDLSGSFAGLGIELGYRKGNLAIIAPLTDSPAQKAGILAGDLIIHVKDEKKGIDEDSFDWPLDKAQTVLRGKKGDKVTLTLLREGHNNNLPFEVEIVRDEIVIKSAEIKFLSKNNHSYALITLSRFGERTPEEWRTIIDQILAHGQTAGVILDLRNNPGGYFAEAIYIASEFLPKGKTIVTQKGRYDSQNYNSLGNGRLVGVPLVVLVNQGSASSSEIVAGALRDQLGVKLIGEETFGKGMIQEKIDLKNGAGLNITIAKWVMPKGDWLEKSGLAVDVTVKDDPQTIDRDEVIERALAEF